ncbi:dethiobiotin synthase [Streptomyces sp. XM4193]|nr:dethiobiotin synthase [Streptomyces sp. XM4193]
MVTAALAAAAAAQGHTVAVLKPAQTGVCADEPGDVAEVVRLTRGTAHGVELARFPDPLAPATAARRAGLPPVGPEQAAHAARELARTHDLVLVEGAGGLLVHLDDRGGTVADVAGLLGAPVLVVAAAGLGTLNATALTAEALRARGLECAGVVVGSLPESPGLAERCNLTDLPTVCGAPLRGVLPQGAAEMEDFSGRAPGWLAPQLYGSWHAPYAPRAAYDEPVSAGGVRPA